MARGVKICLLAASLWCAAGSALAQTAVPFVGRWHWDGPETCAADYVGENRALEIKDRTVIFYESTCRVRRARKLAANSYRLSLVCRGEGETERSRPMFTLLAKSKIHDELLLRIEPKTGFVLAYQRCP